MEDKLLKYFFNIMPLSEEEIEAIDETMEVHQVGKGTVLLKPDEISTAAYFVLEGIIRKYYLVDGEEKTSDFFARVYDELNLVFGFANHIVQKLARTKQLRFYRSQRKIEGFGYFFVRHFLKITHLHQ